MSTEHAQITIANLSNDGDHDKFAHYAEKADITEAFVTGIPIIALCGKIWVPTRDGAGFPVCPKCKEIFSGFSLGSNGQV